MNQEYTGHRTEYSVRLHADTLPSRPAARKDPAVVERVDELSCPVENECELPGAAGDQQPQVYYEDPDADGCNG